MWRYIGKAHACRGGKICPGRRGDGFANGRSLLSSPFEQREKVLLRARVARGFERRHHRVLANYGGSSVSYLPTTQCIGSLRPRVHPFNRCSAATHNLPSFASCVGAPPRGPSSFEKNFQRRQLSTQRGFPPRRGFPQKIIAGAVFLLLAAWGLLFGAITLLLLPFVGLALYLLRRDFQRGGPSKGLVASVARRMAERAERQLHAGANGGPMAQWMQRAPTEGLFSTVLSQMLGGGIRGMQLVGVLRSEVKNRARRHPGLTTALGGDIEAFSDMEMSTVGAAGGMFGPAGGGSSGRNGPSRVIKARLRFVGRRRGTEGAGWAEVEVNDWEKQKGDDGTEGMEYNRVVVTLDNGKTFDLTGLAGDPRENGENESGDATFSSRGARATAGSWKQTGGKTNKDNKNRQGGRKPPVEAEFRDK